MRRTELVTTLNDRGPPAQVLGLRASPILLGAALLPIYARSAQG